MPSSAAPIGIAGAILLLLFSYLGREVWLQSGETLWDFQTYYAAAQAHQEGLNPYDLGLLSEVFGREIKHPYTYPPATLYCFRPFLWMGFETACLVFVGLKVLAFGFLLVIWGRLLAKPGLGLALLVLLPLAYSGAALVDLRAGNISVFEQVLVWLGFASLMRGRLMPFVACILLVASFKLLPIAFLVFLLGQDRGRQSGAIARTAMLVVIALALHLIFSGGYLETYAAAIGLRDERGSINPSSFAFWGSVLHFLAGDEFASASSWLRWLLYLLGVVLVTALTWRKIARRLQGDPLTAFILFSLGYALVMPRFKDYSYLLLVPAAALLVTSRASILRASLLVLVFCLPTHDLHWVRSEGLRGFLSYFPLYCAAGLWFYYLTWFTPPPDHANENRQPSR
ncbi:MAG: glycosyltransferase family 87 protein [Planctomycetota bacterium]|jgi:hypothetical protein